MPLTPNTIGLLLILVGVTMVPLPLIGTAGLNRVRDLWLLAMLGSGTATLALRGSPFAPLGLFFMWHWRSNRELPSLVIWSALALLWEGLREIPPIGWDLLRGLWCAVAIVATVWTCWGWWWMGWHQPDQHIPELWGGRPWWHPYRPIHRGAWFGQRTYSAVFLALTLPLFPAWWVLIPLAGLAVASSWTGWLAAYVALTWLHPWLLWPGLAAGGWFAVMLVWRPEWANWTPRGGSLDPVTERWQVWTQVPPTLLRREWWPWGYGPRTMERGAQRLAIKTGVQLPGPLHADPLHFLFEYGLPGLAALCWLAVLVVPRLHPGDPWAAAVIAGAVCAVGGSPFRLTHLGLVWLACCAKVAA